MLILAVRVDFQKFIWSSVHLEEGNQSFVQTIRSLLLTAWSFLAEKLTFTCKKTGSCAASRAKPLHTSKWMLFSPHTQHFKMFSVIPGTCFKIVKINFLKNIYIYIFTFFKM